MGVMVDRRHRKLTQEDKEEMIRKLQQNKDFQKIASKLNKEGFQQKSITFSLEKGKSIKTVAV